MAEFVFIYSSRIDKKMSILDEYKCLLACYSLEKSTTFNERQFLSLIGMKMQQDISNLFPAYLFWDVDPSRLDVKMDMDLIIPRALYATTAATFDQDISRLESLYSQNQIVDTLKTTKERISNNVCNLVAKHYHIQPFLRFSR